MLIAIAVTSFLASLVTFFSGFGLGTILTPVFALFFPLDAAIGLTAIVHFANNLFKFTMLYKAVSTRTLLKFGVTAVFAAGIGAYTLNRLATKSVLASYDAFGKTHDVTVLGVVIGTVMIFFTLFEVVPKLKHIQFSEKWLPVGGLLSGFFGGLSGHQGALRSAFLTKSGLDKNQFLATGVAIACLVDVTRLYGYSQHLKSDLVMNQKLPLALAIFSAFIGARIGNRMLKSITIDTIQKIVAIGLLILGLAIGSGLI